MLEEELYLRAMHDKDLMMEARNYDSQRVSLSWQFASMVIYQNDWHF